MMDIEQRAVKAIDECKARMIAALIVLSAIFIINLLAFPLPLLFRLIVFIAGGIVLGRNYALKETLHSKLAYYRLQGGGFCEHELNKTIRKANKSL